MLRARDRRVPTARSALVDRVLSDVVSMHDSQVAREHQRGWVLLRYCCEWWWLDITHQIGRVVGQHPEHSHLKILPEQ
jgi:hypothetical protein